MSVSVFELKRWLDTLAEDTEVGVDEGGLTLVTTETADGTSCYLEIGGMSDDDESD